MASKTTQVEHARGMSSINHQSRVPFGTPCGVKIMRG